MGVGPHTPLIIEEERLQTGRADVSETTEPPDFFESSARPRMSVVRPPEGETVVFYGSSDDLVEVEGTIPGCDEYELSSDNLVAFEVAGLRVIVRYHGTWGIEVSQIDEDVPVTAVTQRLWSEGYTMNLELRVPKGSHVSKVY